ncbi:MAG TPA: hypothetical protein VKC34_17430 [Blastocatellia bacterium]|nr:hypothetical protein [Blastocatellia bacterium]
MPTRTERDLSRRRNAFWLLAGLLVAPLAFLLDLEINYALVPVVCLSGNLYLLHLVSAGSLLLSLCGAFIAWRDWEITGREWPGEMAGSIPRSRFMSALGLMTSVLFIILIIAMWVPNFVLDPCQR